MFAPIPPELDAIAKDVVDVAYKLHVSLGPGLLESVYSLLMEWKLRERGYRVEREKPIPIEFEGYRFDFGFRADLIVNNCLIIELKSVEKTLPVHAKQLLTYLRVSQIRLGLLINFGAALLKDGIQRIAN